MMVMTDNPETNWTAYGSYSDQVAFLRIGGNARLSWFDYSQTVNKMLTNNRRTSQRFGVSVRTAPRDWPRVVAAYTKGYNRFKGGSLSTFTTDELELNLDWRIGSDWSLLADYIHFRNVNRQTEQATAYEVANAAIDYQRETSAWGFRLTANNLLDNRTKMSNSLSDFLVSEQVTYIMPRVWLLSVRYKL